jgi:DNA adenine methylase
MHAPRNGGDTQAGSRPLLKWPGGKRAILGAIRPLVPSAFHRYFEPFVGGGALFFALGPAQAVLADKNPELIECYTQVRDMPDQVIRELGALRNTADEYYRIRAWRPTTAPARAARLIYLATLSFNGIYRVNLRGEFNVPYGRKAHLDPCDRDAIYAASSSLANAELRRGDFEETVADASKGDFAYLDPPYTIAHTRNGFLKYNAAIFSWADQTRLAAVSHGLAARGCRVVVSNADHPAIRDLYRDFSLQTVGRASRIAASGDHRRHVTECLFFKGGPGDA